MTEALPHTPAPAPLVDPPRPAACVGLDLAAPEGPEGTFAGTVAADLAVAVSPSTGRFRPADVGVGPLPAGALIGHVTGGGGRADEVRAPVSALLRDVLVRPGQLVGRGQPLAWLQRATTGEPVEIELGWEAHA